MTTDTRGTTDDERPQEARLVAAAVAIGIIIVRNEPLTRHTTFRIGGPADLYAAVGDVDTLGRLAELAAEYRIPTTILGGGSNILVGDAGIRGLVIANQTRGWGLGRDDEGSPTTQPVGTGSAGHAVPDASLVAEAGVALAGLARTAIREGLSGLEWAVSVPGTVGGAVIGNAGAHGGCIADTLAWALVAYPGQGRRVLTQAGLTYSYRSSLLKEHLTQKPSFGEGPDSSAGPVVLSAGFDLGRGDIAEMTGRADGFLARRRASQPVEPSAGSIFRNPPGDFAGRLIEAVGLRGQQLGGAQISPRHANFIVNTGAAKATDVLGLIRLAQSRVAEQYGVKLLPEILFLGEW